MKRNTSSKKGKSLKKKSTTAKAKRVLKVSRTVSAKAKTVKKTTVRAQAKAPIKRVVAKIAPKKLSKKAVAPSAEDKAIEEILKRVEAINAARLITFRGQEITRPMKIERMVPKKPESKWDFSTVQEPAVTPVAEEVLKEEMVIDETPVNQEVEMPAQESNTVMIRSVSPLQTLYTNSSEPYVEKEPEVSQFRFSRALSLVGVFALAVVVISGGVFKLGTKTAEIVAQREDAPRVAGAETASQPFTFNKQFVFLYPTNWIVVQKGSVLTLTDSQDDTNAAHVPSAITVTASSLSGKSFQQWLASQKQFTGKTAERLDNTEVLSYRLRNADGTESNTYAFLVGTSQVVTVNLARESTVAARTVFDQVVRTLRFL